MTEVSPRPIGTEFTAVTESETERVILTLRVIGHAHRVDAPGMVEITMPVAEERLTKEPLGGREKK